MAFGLLLFYTALLFVRPMEWVPWMLGWNILDYVAVAALVATLATLLNRDWKLEKAPQNWLMLGLFFACLMSHVRHTYLAALIETFQTFGKIVLFYFLISINVNTLRRVRLLIGVVVAGCLFMTLHGILQWHTGMGFGGQPPLIVQETKRVVAFGFFHDPNDLALMLVTILPFLVSKVFARGTAVLSRVLALAAITPMVYCIFLTNSRGGWLALGAMAVAYAALHLPRKRGIVLGAIAFVAVMALGPSRMGTLTADERAGRGRLVAWADGNRMLKQWPIFGAGKGRFTEFSEDSRVAHNSFVHCWAELGLFGYFFWLGLIVACLKDGLGLAKISSENPETQEISRLARAGVAALVGFLAAAFFLSRTYIYPLYILFGLFAALRSIHETDFGRPESAFVRHDLRYVLIAELATIPGLYVLMRFLW